VTFRPITHRRAGWLRTIHQLATELRRPPHSSEIARAVGCSERSGRQRVQRAAVAGHVIVEPRVTAFVPAAVRLAPRAMLELALPVVVYLAWPLSTPSAGTTARLQSVQAGMASAEWLLRMGLFAVSPYLIPHHQFDAIDEVARQIAARADAVVVWHDRILVGRSDVAAAHRLGVPVSVLTPEIVRSGVGPADLWRPPCLQPEVAGCSQATPAALDI
jgi:hypothetical protein